MKLFDVYPINDITIERQRARMYGMKKVKDIWIYMAGMPLSLSAIHTHTR